MIVTKHTINLFYGSMSEIVQDKSLWRKQIGDLLKPRWSIFHLSRNYGKYILERDGWTTLDSSYFLEAGFPKEFVEPLIKITKSDGTMKGSLWKNDTCYFWFPLWHELLDEIRKKFKHVKPKISGIPRDFVEGKNLSYVKDIKIVHKDCQVYDEKGEKVEGKKEDREYSGEEIYKKFTDVYIPEQKGVYYLDFLRALERLFDVQSMGCIGRGSQAGQIINVIHFHLGITKDEFGHDL